MKHKVLFGISDKNSELLNLKKGQTVNPARDVKVRMFDIFKTKYL